MKTLYTITHQAAIFALSLLCSCTEAGAPLTVEAEDNPLYIGSVGVNSPGLVTRAEHTRVLNDPSDEIGLFLKKDDQSGYEAINNKQYTYNSPTWDPKDENQLLLKKPRATLTAYYPYKETGLTVNDADGSVTVPLTTAPYKATDEFYYSGSFEASFWSSSITLSLKRAYSLLRFSFIKSSGEKGEYTGDGLVKGFTCTVTNLPKAGTLELYSGDITGVTNGDLTFSPDDFNAGSMEKPANCDYLVVPSSSFDGTVTFSCTIDGLSLTDRTVSAAELCGGTSPSLKPGVAYTIRVVILPTGLSVGTLQYEEWEKIEINEELTNK